MPTRSLFQDSRQKTAANSAVFCYNREHFNKKLQIA